MSVQDVPPRQAPDWKSPYEGVFPARVDFTIGAETSNTINVSMQFQSGGMNLYEPGVVHAYLSDNSDGSTLAASAPSGGWVIGTNGLLIPIVSNKAAILKTAANGVVDVTITETTDKTFYVAVVLPNGRLEVSGAVNFD